MRKAMLNRIKTACVITAATSLAALGVQAADPLTTSPSTTTTGTAGYGTSTESTATADHSAKGFLKQAFRDNQLEVDLAGIGINKAQNAELKSFCEMIQKDHTQANKDLAPLAQKYGVNEEMGMLGKHEVNKFEKETAGADFDKKLATEFLKGHQKDISKFEKASTKLREADLKQYVDTMLPKLREHLQHAETVARAVGVDQSTISSVMSKTPAVGGTTETQESGTATGTSGKTDQGAGARQLEPSTPSTQPK